MGDRGNIVVINNLEAQPLFLYTHWTGTELPATLAAGLKKYPVRWEDGIYLARILFCEMVKGSEMAETGFGISTEFCDGNHDMLVVSVPQQKVFTVNEREARNLPLYCIEHADEGIPFALADEAAICAIYDEEPVSITPRNVISEEQGTA